MKKILIFQNLNIREINENGKNMSELYSYQIFRFIKKVLFIKKNYERKTN